MDDKIAATELPDLYTLSDAAAAAGIAVSTAKDRADRAGLGKESVGGGIRFFTAADVDALKKGQKSSGRPSVKPIRPTT